MFGWRKKPEPVKPDPEALRMLESARVYLEQYGQGRNLEYDRARHILELAKLRVQGDEC